MSIKDHLQSYLSRASSSQRTLDADQDLIQSLQTSVEPLVNATGPFQATQRRSTEDAEDLWSQFIRHVSKASPETKASKAAIDTNGDAPTSSQASEAVSALNEYLSALAASDPQLAESVTQSVRTALSSSRSSDDISAELAEAIGFQHLDLVSSVVADRHVVLDFLQQQQQQTLTRDIGSNGSSYASEATSSRLIALPTTSNHLPASETTHRSARPYIPGSQVVIQTPEERQQAKRLKNEMRRANRARGPEDGDELHAYTAEELEQLREESLMAAANRPLYSGTSTGTADVKYPHVFSAGAQGNILSAFGQKFALPVGTVREEKQFYEEVTIPPPKTVPMRFNERYIPINEMDSICRGSFPGYKSLNRLQSAVYPLAYKTNENLLICAPTGAGKTDVAMLTVMRAISQYARNLEPTAGQGAAGFDIAKNDFKIIYVAPMKALAAEIVRKFSKRLQYLGIKVRELTGDMQMTRQEIAETQMIVTTPEKWDVVTRKPTGEGELATKVRLLIIDEVHLLHDERGSVIETIVARTLRLVESSQSLIRIVGLSATLPNYVDVADFLRVNRFQGLFYFDSSFRPVPLEQHFLGVKGKAGSHQARANLDKACFEKVSELVQAGHQVMVFVHARKETVKTAQTLREMFREEAMGDILQASSDENPRKAFFKKELQTSRNREMKELFDYGFGIHHAGMLRSDRTLSERMFEAGVTRVLCCTATLAWGVNLPAYAVVIKGTDVYDSSAGKFVDLSILDVLQIFGRAGRPQYEDLGVGYILTSEERLSHYVDAITSQHPIESKFIGGLIDSLNAEISLGTVGSIRDGVSWLGYTFLFTRMRKTPLTYGMTYDEVADDPHLGAKRQQLITMGVKKLVEAKMVYHDSVTDHLQVTDLGRVAAKYYIGYRTIEIFNERLRPNMSEADVLGLLSQATDFEQIIPRDAEEKELKKMLENAPCEVSGGIETSPGKVNLLLQAYISRTFIEDFALVSDSGYVAQNAGRIIRSLLEIALSRRWSRTASAFISMSKAIEKRMWPFDHPLQQSQLHADTLYAVTERADDVEISELAEMSALEIANLIRVNNKTANAIRQAARSFPRLAATTFLRPLSHDLLRIDVRIERDFEWSERQLGHLHGFYIWIEDEDGVDILQWLVHLTRSTDSSTSKISFTIPMSDAVPNGLNLRWMSDSWLGSEDSVFIPFDDLVMPQKPPPHDALLDLPLLPVHSSIQDELLRERYVEKFSAFNALQTQCFHTMMHTASNTLLCAPNAAGKSTVASLAVWRALDRASNKAVIVLHAKRDSLAAAFRSILASSAKLKGVIIERTSVVKTLLPLVRETYGPRIIITTPATLLRAMDSYSDLLRHITLLIAEDLQLLDPSYELALTLFMYKSVSIDEEDRPRLVATSASMNDASSFAQWLGADENSTYNFHPKDRPSILTTSFQSFDLPHSAGLLKTMVKPAFDKMKECKLNGPSIVVVPSRGQCYTVASDLITRAASEMDTDGFIGMPSDEIESILSHVQDGSLHEALLHGIGIIHENVVHRDRQLIEHLYEQGLVKALVVPRECCWSLTSRAHLVVIMSTQYVRLTRGHGATATSDRELVDYTLAELSRMQSLAVRPGTPSDPNPAGECLVLCQTDKVSIFEKMLTSGMPLHSTLLQPQDRAPVLLPIVLQEIVKGSIAELQHITDFLTWTILPAELSRNPSYYDCPSSENAAVSMHLKAIASSLVSTLQDLRLIERNKDPDTLRSSISGLQATDLGKALQLQPGSTLLHLARWHSNLSSRPNKAAKEVQTFSATKSSPKDRDTIKDEAQRDVLLATLSVIPSEWKSAFQLPSATASPTQNGDAAVADGSEVPKAEEAAPAEKATESAKQPSSLTLADKRSILLCLYFSKLDLITTSRAQFLTLSRRAQKKQQKQGPGEQLDGDSKLGPEDQKQLAAIEKLERDLASEVLALLHATTSVGGRN